MRLMFLTFFLLIVPMVLRNLTAQMEEKRSSIDSTLVNTDSHRFMIGVTLTGTDLLHSNVLQTLGIGLTRTDGSLQYPYQLVRSRGSLQIGLALLYSPIRHLDLLTSVEYASGRSEFGRTITWDHARLTTSNNTQIEKASLTEHVQIDMEWLQWNLDGLFEIDRSKNVRVGAYLGAGVIFPRAASYSHSLQYSSNFEPDSLFHEATKGLVVPERDSMYAEERSIEGMASSIFTIRGGVFISVIADPVEVASSVSYQNPLGSLLEEGKWDIELPLGLRIAALIRL